MQTVFGTRTSTCRFESKARVDGKEAYLSHTYHTSLRYGHLDLRQPGKAELVSVQCQDFIWETVAEKSGHGHRHSLRGIC